jgi:hypothetical protein
LRSRAKGTAVRLSARIDRALRFGEEREERDDRRARDGDVTRQSRNLDRDERRLSRAIDEASCSFLDRSATHPRRTSSAASSGRQIRVSTIALDRQMRLP